MTVRSHILGAIERNEAFAKQELAEYSTVSSEIVEEITKFLAKLPSGERVAENYSEFATESIARQRENAEKFFERQAELQSWLLGERNDKASV